MTLRYKGERDLMYLSDKYLFVIRYFQKNKRSHSSESAFLIFKFSQKKIPRPKSKNLFLAKYKTLQGEVL